MKLRNMCKVSLTGIFRCGKCSILREDNRCSFYHEYNSQFRVGVECAHRSNYGSCMSWEAIDDNTPLDMKALIALEKL